MWTNKSLDKEDKERRKNATRLKETDTKKMGLMYMATGYNWKKPILSPWLTR